MANYVLLATVTAKLPTGYNATISDNRISTTLIVEASNECDDLVGAGFSRSYNSNAQKFPEITDTPATPVTIQLCALWLTLSRVYEELSDIANNASDEENETPNKVYYRRLAEQKLEAVRSGVIDLTVEMSGQVQAQNKYFDSDVENDMDHKHKWTEMDTYYP